MTPERFTRVRALFQGALDRPPSEREAWLRQEASGETDLLREVWALLDAHESAGDFLTAAPDVLLEELADPGLDAGARLGPYRILEELGRGGMGVVYLAEDTRLGRRVALKSLAPVVASDSHLRERLRREARAAATITHPCVAIVYALEEIDDRVLIASEYVRGETLRSALAAGPLPETRARAIAIDIARALVAAHDAGVVHRDLKPENVLITDEGGVKVVDFGIAQVEGIEATRLTITGSLLGTPAYMAPEQLTGGTVDGRTDVYAAGIVLAEMTTGHHPLHDGTGVLPPAVAAIVARCLQPTPNARYASARELLRALEQMTTGAVPGGSALGWWVFHQVAVAVVYGAMTVAAWAARGVIGGGAGRTVFALTLTSAIVAAVVRLHLWFTSRHYPQELDEQRARVARWVQGADWLFAGTVTAAGLLIADTRPALAILLFSVGLGAAIAFLVIEPATARAAFRNAVPAPRRKG